MRFEQVDIKITLKMASDDADRVTDRNGVVYTKSAVDQIKEQLQEKLLPIKVFDEHGDYVVIGAAYGAEVIGDCVTLSGRLWEAGTIECGRLNTDSEVEVIDSVMQVGLCGKCDWYTERQKNKDDQAVVGFAR